MYIQQSLERTYKMLKYDRIDLSEGIDVKKCNKTSRQCSLCKFCYFLNKNFNYQTYLCDGCHDISIKATSMQNLDIIYHGGNAYRINFVFISKNDAINLIKIIFDSDNVLEYFVNIYSISIFRKLFYEYV